MKIEIVDNVWSFLNKASVFYSSFKEQEFSHEMYSNCVELGIKSPIEHLFLIACHTLCASQYTTVNPEPAPWRGDMNALGQGLFIQPQFQIDKYRVDFLLSQNGIGPNEILTPVVVELDGHDFHDKDKKQRSYEKARDRHLVKKGLRVIHFTGSDVVSDPFKVAFEALEMMGVYAGSGIDEYNPRDPMGMGV